MAFSLLVKQKDIIYSKLQIESQKLVFNQNFEQHQLIKLY